MSGPPPPKPNGSHPRTSAKAGSAGLPPGNYDIFVIPPHSSGSGFLYLPSLSPNMNSFAAGFACALITVAGFQIMGPTIQTWLGGSNSLKNIALSIGLLIVGAGSWYIGRLQTTGFSRPTPTMNNEYQNSAPPPPPPPPPQSHVPQDTPQDHEYAQQHDYYPHQEQYNYQDSAPQFEEPIVHEYHQYTEVPPAPHEPTPPPCQSSPLRQSSPPPKPVFSIPRHKSFANVVDSTTPSTPTRAPRPVQPPTPPTYEHSSQRMKPHVESVPDSPAKPKVPSPKKKVPREPLIDLDIDLEEEFFATKAKDHTRSPSKSTVKPAMSKAEAKTTTSTPKPSKSVKSVTKAEVKEDPAIDKHERKTKKVIKSEEPEKAEKVRKVKKAFEPIEEELFTEPTRVKKVKKTESEVESPESVKVKKVKKVVETQSEADLPEPPKVRKTKKIVESASDLDLPVPPKIKKAKKAVQPIEEEEEEKVVELAKTKRTKKVVGLEQIDSPEPVKVKKVKRTKIISPPLIVESESEPESQPVSRPQAKKTKALKGKKTTIVRIKNPEPPSDLDFFPNLEDDMDFEDSETNPEPSPRPAKIKKVKKTVKPKVEIETETDAESKPKRKTTKAVKVPKVEAAQLVPGVILPPPVTKPVTTTTKVEGKVKVNKVKAAAAAINSLASLSSPPQNSSLTLTPVPVPVSVTTLVPAPTSTPVAAPPVQSPPPVAAPPVPALAPTPVASTPAAPPKPNPLNAWERAREETRRKEEERKAKEAEQKRREEAAKRLQELREKEKREREARERETQRLKEKAEAERLAREKAARERIEQDKREREAKEKAEKERLARLLREARERDALEKIKKEREIREKEREQMIAAARVREAKEREEREAKKRKEKEEAEKAAAVKALAEKIAWDKMMEEKAEAEKIAIARAARETKERLAREAKEKEEKERLQKLREQREYETKEKAEAERLAKLKEAQERECMIQAAKKREEEERARKEAEKEKIRTGSYAFSSVGEKTKIWPNGKPSVPKSTVSAPGGTESQARPHQPPPKPRAEEAYTEIPRKAPGTRSNVDDNTYSYRPYDPPKNKPPRPASVSEMSDESWAPSQSTQRTTPPPAFTSHYSTPNPDKIGIRAVYMFMNQFSKTPATQLISGQAPVTNGLVLRMTTEGLFIDDDTRGVPQREWDVKAWTLKSMEVWCPQHCINPSAATPTGSAPGLSTLHKFAGSRVRPERGGTRVLQSDEAGLYVSELMKACKGCCAVGMCESQFSDMTIPSPNGLHKEWRSKGLHILRATIKDQEGKRYLVVIDEEEAWKLAVGLQKLRKGSQCRALGIAGLAASEARGIMEMLGWQ